MGIVEAFARLRTDAADLHGSLHAQIIDGAPYVKNLAATIERLQEKLESGRPSESPLDADIVWARWESLGYDLSKLEKREVRSLCVSPVTSMRGRLIHALNEDRQPLQRISNLHGLVYGYCSHWRMMEEPQKAEDLIWRGIEQDSMARRGRVIKVWRQSRFLFTSHAAARIAQLVLSERRSPKEICESLFIDPTTVLATRSHEAAVIQFVDSIVQKAGLVDERKALSDLDWLISNLLTDDLDPGIYRDAIAKLILSSLTSFPSYQKALAEEIQADRRLGDPRLPERASNWRLVSDAAKARFLAWLAKATLQFFFDILVPRNDDNRRRAEFWLQYAKREGNIRDFQVAVSDEDESKIRYSRAKVIPSYSRVVAPRASTSSAFLMVFEAYGKEYVIIEFSETGNATYIYERKTFELRGAKIRALSFDLKNELKRMHDVRKRISHIGQWEGSAVRTLAELGIRP
jgi:EH_Signature domain